MNIPPTPILLRCRANELNQCPILVGVMRMTKKSATKWAAVTILLVSFARATILFNPPYRFLDVSALLKTKS